MGITDVLGREDGLPKTENKKFNAKRCQSKGGTEFFLQTKIC